MDPRKADEVAVELTPPLTRHPSQERRNATLNFAHAVRDSAAVLSSGNRRSPITLTGEQLGLSDVVAIARLKVKVNISDSSTIRDRIHRSVATLAKKLRAGELVYGVNTGYGGSADTRTSDLISLQRALVQHQHTGVLTGFDIGSKPSKGGADGGWKSTSMPTSWVRGMMLSRINSLLRGHSAVSMPIIEAIATLLNHDLTPVVPLRGSISASGDLQPLSYVAGLLQGNPSVYVRCHDDTGDRIVTAPEALRLANLKPVTLGAKEGLGLLNGTAASVAVASLVLHDTRHLAILAQALTAMAVEALSGTLASFDPFISAARPHPGQGQVAATIRAFLEGSKLTADALGTDVHHKPSGLCQDRYALRTSPQWIGPLLEDLDLATRQIEVELDSATDNPLIETRGTGAILHGGNFQASSVTSAMEKTRNALQQLGKMLFAQSTEMNNASMSRGLPPNLCADDPSTSFTCKGIDITMAAYASELGWLNHPVGPHVQSAEMHNQAINSLALLSSRMTHQAVEVLTCLCAAYLFMVCQALDLRVLLVRFYTEVESGLKQAVSGFLGSCGIDDESWSITTSLWASFPDTWSATSTMDLAERCDNVAEAMTGKLINATASRSSTSIGSISLNHVKTCRRDLSTRLRTTYEFMRSELFADSLKITPAYLGRAASTLYTFVRSDLGVPFIRGLVDDPTEAFAIGDPMCGASPDRERKTLGCWISIIYEAMEDGSFFAKLADIV